MFSGVFSALRKDTTMPKNYLWLLSTGCSTSEVFQWGLANSLALWGTFKKTSIHIFLDCDPRKSTSPKPTLHTVTLHTVLFSLHTVLHTYTYTFMHIVEGAGMV